MTVLTMPKFCMSMVWVSIQLFFEASVQENHLAKLSLSSCSRPLGLLFLFCFLTFGSTRLQQVRYAQTTSRTETPGPYLLTKVSRPVTAEKIGSAIRSAEGQISAKDELYVHDREKTGHLDKLSDVTESELNSDKVLYVIAVKGEDRRDAIEAPAFRYAQHSPSSYDHRTWPREQGLNRANNSRRTVNGHVVEPIFLCYRPAYAAGMPASLGHQVFGHFVDDLSIDEWNKRDCAFVKDLCTRSLLTYSDEGSRQAMLEKMFSLYLSRDCGPYKEFSDSQAETVGFIGVRDKKTPACYAIYEYENEIGATNTDKWFQGQAYHQLFWREFMSSTAFNGSSCPSFLIEVLGPYLRVSAMMLLGNGDEAKVHSMPLTEHLLLAVLPYEQQKLHLLRVMCALRKGIVRLEEFYTGLYQKPRISDRLRGLKMSAPYPFWDGELADRFVPDPNQSDPLRKKPLLYTGRLDGRPVVVKFTQRYGLKVHLRWAAAGFAPNLLPETRKLPGGWYMVVMDLLVPEEWVPLCEVSSDLQEGAREWALATLTKAHDLEVEPEDGSEEGAKGVHGDMRHNNVMVNTMDSKVMFVDFDWAGVAGRQRYPPYMNHVNIGWPQGAEDNSVMQQAHDTAALKKEGLSPSHYNWIPAV